jgi:hypothetical protein
MDDFVLQLPSNTSVVIIAVRDGGLITGILHGLQKAG